MDAVFSGVMNVHFFLVSHVKCAFGPLLRVREHRIKLSHEIKALFMSSKEDCVPPPPKGQLTALEINQTAKLFSSSIFHSQSLDDEFLTLL